jgi:hypothetical protein
LAGLPARRRQPKEIILEEGLDGVGLQETIKESFSQKELTPDLGVLNSHGRRSVSKGTLIDVMCLLSIARTVSEPTYAYQSGAPD